MTSSDRLSRWRISLAITGSFLVLAPLITYLLIVLRGLPSFALPYLGQVLGWVYSVTWGAALLSGILLSAVVTAILARTSFFHQPYDFGRCLSLGAIVGALAEAVSTLLYRLLFHRLFSNFWVAGAMIAGCLAGAAITATVLWRASSLVARPGRRG